MTPLTSATEIDIRVAFRNLCGSGVPEEHLADMLATHAIGLLENQRPEWFGDVPRTPETVLRATIGRLRDAINNPPDGDDDAWKSAMRVALREHEAAIAAASSTETT